MTTTETHTKLERLGRENAELRARLQVTEQHTAKTLRRATRLAQVISILGHDADLETLVGRTSVEIAELFAADIAVLMLGSDHALEVAGQSGLRTEDVPRGPFPSSAPPSLTGARPVRIGPFDDLSTPDWIEPYGVRHVAWVRLLEGEESLGLMLLARRAEEPFARSDETELLAIANRIGMAIENGQLHERMRAQLVRLHGLQKLTTELAGTLELEGVGRRVVEMLVSEVGVAGCALSVLRDGELTAVSRAGIHADGETETIALEASHKTVGRAEVTGAPEDGSPERELLLHVLGLAALALDKALAYERSREQARRDSLTGLLGHRVFQEALAGNLAEQRAFSLVLVDIDDFKRINDLYGHQTGDHALRRVAETLRRVVRPGDTVYRVGGEEFCAILPSVGQDDAYAVAERLRSGVTEVVAAMPVTVSLGVASFPAHGETRDALLSQADLALYASKRSGKNRTSIAGIAPAAAPATHV